MRITYNAPFVLSYTFLAIGIMLLNNFTGGRLMADFFTLPPVFNFRDPFDYFRLLSHALGHANWGHLASNFAYILLIGPILEEKYGSKNLFVMSLITALVTGILNIFFFPTALLGASGIVFMMILLGSFTNVKSGYIPLTFILILALYLGQEVLAAFETNNISEFAHIVGGVCGSIFGFVQNSRLAK